MSKIVPVTLEVFLQILKHAQEEHAKKDESLPEINNLNIPKIKTALDQPFQTFGGRQLYKGFPSKASMMFYSIVADHILTNGNKRMACLVLAVFCFLNNYRLTIHPDLLRAMAMAVASPHDEEKIKKRIYNTIKKHLKRVKKE